MQILGSEARRLIDWMAVVDGCSFLVADAESPDGRAGTADGAKALIEERGKGGVILVFKDNTEEVVLFDATKPEGYQVTYMLEDGCAPMLLEHVRAGIPLPLSLMIGGQPVDA